MARILRESHQHPDYPTLHLDLRSDSRYFQARAYLEKDNGPGKTVKLKSTKTTALPTAFRIAEEWYRRELRASARKPVDRLAADPTIAEMFSLYREKRPEKQRLDDESRWGPIQHYWRTVLCSEVTSQTFDDFYQWRRKRRKTISAHTLHKDVVLIRQVLKLATQKGHIPTLPFIPKIGRIIPNPRPWLSKAEWEHLRAVAEMRVEHAAGNPRVSRQRQDCYEFALFMVASMCRVDELRSLRFSHCQIESVEKLKKRFILRCEFKGKTGMRTAYASPEAVTIYKSRLKRVQDAGALVFPEHHRDAFRELLKAAHLYVDHFGNRRNYKAMRATSISLAILRPNPPTLFQIARNAGTSVAVIENFYAKRLTSEHGKDALTTVEPLQFMWGKTRK